MKIVFISLMKILPWGGSEELWYKTAKLATAHGHSVSSLTQYWPTVPNKIFELQQLGIDTQFYYTPTYSIADRIGIKLRLKKNILEIVPSISADVYVISNGSVFDFIYHRQTIKEILVTGKPYIMISQHNVEHGNVMADIFRNYAIDVINKSRGFFFVSERNLRVAERQIPYKLDNATVISNPLNIDTISIKPYPASDSLLMACVARLDCDFKGQDILLQVLSTGLWKGRAFRLNLYGAGPHLDYLARLIKFYDLNDKVFLAGHVNDIDELWGLNQVLVLPSLSEGTPLALVEAMLSGRAAVSTDVGGNATYIIDGETGYLADVASVKCLSNVLEKLWINKSFLPDMGIKAFNRAKEITDLHPDQTLLSFIEKVD